MVTIVTSIEIINRARQIMDDNKTVQRSAWGRGVQVYAHELLDTLAEALSGGYFDAADLGSARAVCAALRNGANSWEQYSRGGCALVYDCDIADRLCTPSELKKTRNGERRPNSREEWIDVQARALRQAATRAARAVVQAARENAAKVEG